MITRAAALVLALVAASAFADIPPIPLNSMLCYHSDGSVSAKESSYAHAHRGGIIYGAEPGAFLTTEQCIAHLPPQPGLTGTMEGFIYCTGDMTIGTTYYGSASTAALTAGVWTWVEEGTGDVYVASLPCELHIGFVPGNERDGR